MTVTIAVVPPPGVGDPDSFLGMMGSILQYGRKLRAWKLEMAPGSDWRRIGPRVDAVLALQVRERIDGRARAARLPCVHLIDPDPTGRRPSVIYDDLAIGALAAEHLLDKHLRCFFYLGLENRVGHLRGQGFTQRLRQAGCGEDQVKTVIFEPAWMRDPERLGKLLLGEIDKVLGPVGMLAFNDHVAFEAIEALTEAGLRVPDDVAVMGLGDAYLRCEFAQVPITSIDRNAEQIGLQGARLLDRLLAGQSVPAEPILVKPRGVTQRQSTDLVALPDAQVAEAVKIIRDRACEDLTIEQVLEAVPLSRSSLERKFRRWLGRSPAEEIRSVKLKHARELVTTTDLALADVAARCGFGSVSYFVRAFREAFGQTPARYRDQNSTGGIHDLPGLSREHRSGI